MNLKTTMLKFSLCDYSDSYILVKGNISVNKTAAAGDDANNTNEKVNIQKLYSIHCLHKWNK